MSVIEKLNRSFSRRIGKTLSPLQKSLLENELTNHNFLPEKAIEILANKKAYLEIGFGMGEHFVQQAGLSPEAIFIGCEPYLNGVANVLKLAKEKAIENFYLWPDDLDLMIDFLPDSSLSGIFILFPDPWPKRKQQKKRIFNQLRLTVLHQKLKPGSFLIFASDISDYFLNSVNLIKQSGLFTITWQEFSKPHEGYITTKFHQKAIAAGRKAQFLIANKI